MRFVDQDDGAIALRNPRDEGLLENAKQLVAGSGDRVPVVGYDAEVAEELAQEIVGAERRVDDRREQGVRPHVVRDRPAQHRLAGPCRAGDDDNAFAGAKGQHHLFEGLGVRAAPEEEARVGRQAERRFDELEVFVVRARARRGRKGRESRTIVER